MRPHAAPLYNSAYSYRYSPREVARAMDFTSLLILAAMLAFVPTIIYALMIWWLDRYEKEPVPLLLVAFVWGALPAIILALILEIGLDIPLQQFIPGDAERDITTASLVAPIVEEAVKAIILVVLFIAYKREFDNVLDGVIYGAMVGLGFAFVENVLYFSSAASVDEMIMLWVLRAGIFGLNHSMFTAFTGAALGLARSLRVGWQKGLVPSLGLGVAMIFHGLHNALVSAVGLLSNDESNSGLVLGVCLGALVSDYGGVLLILGVAIGSSVREGRIIRETLLEEVKLGRFTHDEYDILISGRRRWGARWKTLTSWGFKRWRQTGRFFDLATELAFRKHRMHDGDPIHQNISARDIARIRQEIDTLRSVILAA
ncbi:MAG: PrsW family intramembrane metalloprotease [Chloroflexia bacterium]